MKKGQKKVNNIKWQLNGVLDEYHLPKKSEHLQDNFGFKSEITELQRHVKHKKAVEGVMSRMSDLKLESMISGLNEKLGIINRRVSTDMKLNKLCEELYVSSAEKRKKRKMSTNYSPQHHH